MGVLDAPAARKVRTKTIKSRFESIITIGGTMITYDDSEYYVGLSLSNCVTSIFKGEMRKRQVIGMMTNTRCDTLKDYLDVLDNYLTVSYWSGLFDTRNDLNRLINIAYYLYSEIPFHQPRVEQGYVLVSNAPDNPKLNLQEPIFWRDVTWMIAYKDKFSSYWHKKKPINRHDELLNMETIEKFKDDVYEKLLESGHEFRDKVSS